MLAASVAGFKVVANKAYDTEELAEYLDIVNVNTYDYHGFWDRKTGHHSPIKANSNNANDEYNMVISFCFWTNIGFRFFLYIQ